MKFDECYQVTASGCWIWTKAINGSGYGVFYDAATKKIGLAHRWVYARENGPIRPRVHVLHRCDTPPCVNPAHLFSGTHADNMRDRDSKGRCQHGEKHYAAKLTEPDVAQIRALHASGVAQRALAKRFGVDPSNISLVVTRKIWAGVDHRV